MVYNILNIVVIMIRVWNCIVTITGKWKCVKNIVFGHSSKTNQKHLSTFYN